MGLKAWKSAQERESAYWIESKNQVISPEHIRNKKLYAKDVSEVLTGRPIVQVGAGADAMINFMDGQTIGLDPLFHFYKSNMIGFDNIEMLSGVGEGIPIKDESVGSIICFNMLDHTSNPEKVLEEMIRILKPNGRMFLMVHAKSLVLWLYRKVIKDDMHPNPILRKRLLKQLDALGLETIQNNSDEETIRVYLEKSC